MPSSMTLPKDLRQLVPAFLGAAAFFLSFAIVPPSSYIYLLKANIAPTHVEADLSTVWLNSLGYCVASSDFVSNAFTTPTKCTGYQLGYDVEGLSNIALGPTRVISVINPVALMLCLIALAISPIITIRSKMSAHLCVFATSMLAYFVSMIALIMEMSLMTRLRDGKAAGTIPHTTSFGIVGYASILAVLCQFIACGLCFFTGIGAAHDESDDAERGEEIFPAYIPLPPPAYYEAADQFHADEKTPVVEEKQSTYTEVEAELLLEP